MTVDIRELRPEDLEALRAFFAEVPAEDRTFFKEDVTDPAVAERWVNDTRCIWQLAVDDAGAIAGFAALLPGVERSSHVAEIVLVVAAHARRHGVGTTLARRTLIEAVERGFKKVTVEVAAENTGAVEMFQRIGFDAEALLRDQLVGEDGQMHDMLILAHAVDEQWSAMLSGGIDEAVA